MTPQQGLWSNMQLTRIFRMNIYIKMLTVFSQWSHSIIIYQVDKTIFAKTAEFTKIHIYPSWPFKLL